MGGPVITLDTSGLYALLNRRDRQHAAAKRAFEADAGPYLVPCGILAEITYIVEERLGQKALAALLGDIEGAMQVDCGDEDMARIRGLVRRYASLPLGFADASVIACAERNGGRVLALDEDFRVVAREGSIEVLPE